MADLGTPLSRREVLVRGRSARPRHREGQWWGQEVGEEGAVCHFLFV